VDFIRFFGFEFSAGVANLLDRYCSAAGLATQEKAVKHQSSMSGGESRLVMISKKSLKSYYG